MYLINQELEQIRTTVFRQLMFADFSKLVAASKFSFKAIIKLKTQSLEGLKGLGSLLFFSSPTFTYNLSFTDFPKLHSLDSHRKR